MARRSGKLPKLLGIALVLVAFSHAFDPNWPVPLDQARGKALVAPMPSGPPTPGEFSVDSPAVVFDQASERTFSWHSTVAAGSWQVMLLDENRHEIAWGAPTRQPRYRPEGEFRAALAAGRGRYWYAVGEAAGRRLRSDPTLVTPR
jgi:hypothetical protein